MKNILGIILSLILIYPSFAEEKENVVLDATITKSAIRGNVYVYNLSNGKLHTPNCEWALKCTKNCIYLDKRELKNKFYIPCMVCGGGIIEPADLDE